MDARRQNTAAHVKFRRATRFYGRVRKLKVLVDGQPRLELKHADEQTVSLQPGEHTVRTKMDWATSPEVRIEARDGLIIECGVRPFFVALLFTFVAPRRLFTVTVDDASVAG